MGTCTHRDKNKNKHYADSINGYEIDASSIQRVPCIQITQDRALNNLIKTIHQKLLYETLMRNDGHKFDEVGCLLELIEPYRNTDMIFGYYNKNTNTSSINAHNNKEYTDYMDTHLAKQLIFMHTHPNNSGLSYGDIYNLIVNDKLYAVTAVCNNGGVYAVYKNDKFNTTDLKNKIRKFNLTNRKIDEQERIKIENKIVKRLMAEQDKYGIIFKYSIRR